MGRHIYAEEIGSNKDDTWVHKFWVAVQPSDVSDYLDASGPNHTLATLSVDHENDIKEKINDLKMQFNKEFGITYEQYMTARHEYHGSCELLASRINLGEHLLQTIENMKEVGIEKQLLTIEL